MDNPPQEYDQAQDGDHTQQNTDSYAADYEVPQGEEPEQEGYVTPLMKDVFSAQMSEFLAISMISRAKAIEHEMAQLQYEVEIVTKRAEMEKENQLTELSRLSNLVVSFQQSIMQFLPLGTPFQPPS